MGFPDATLNLLCAIELPDPWARQSLGVLYCQGAAPAVCVAPGLVLCPVPEAAPFEGIEPGAALKGLQRTATFDIGFCASLLRSWFGRGSY